LANFRSGALAPASRALYIAKPLMNPDNARLNKLRFRAWRRGFREADLILGPFADKHVAGFSASELDAFERLLEVPDHDLYAWITDRIAAPPEWDGALLNQIKIFRLELDKHRGGDRGG
jgi:antitoxin CptB